MSNLAKNSGQNEFKFTQDNFLFIKDIIYDLAGINLTEAKRAMVYARLTKRLRALRLNDFDAYCKMLKAGDPNELHFLLNSLTTNLTAFFRENHHFDYLKDNIVPSWMQQHSGIFNVWSSACSTGQEPYSISYILSKFKGLKYNILASDIDSNVLNTAQAGVYPLDLCEKLDKNVLQHMFLKGRGSMLGQVKVQQNLQEYINFQKINLVKPWNIKTEFDVIFCRNVVIYFDQQTKDQLFTKFAKQLKIGGYLFLGHSEMLTGDATKILKNVSRMVYKKIQ